MAVEIEGTGVLIRAATAEEIAAIRRAHFYGRDVREGPVLRGSHRLTYPTTPVAAADEVDVVSIAFVEFRVDGRHERWTDAQHFGHRVATSRDATKELLALAQETEEEGFVSLLTDMRIAGYAVTRWQLHSAPRRYELDPGLQARLAPPR